MVRVMDGITLRPRVSVTDGATDRGDLVERRLRTRPGFHKRDEPMNSFSTLKETSCHTPWCEMSGNTAAHRRILHRVSPAVKIISTMRRRDGSKIEQ